MRSLTQHEREVRDKIMKLDKGIDDELIKDLKVEIQELNSLENCCLYFANFVFCLLLPLYLCSIVKVVGQK
jgi:hypothetical protein